MSVALGLLLIGQLNSFEFTPIPSPQTVGDSFSVTVLAKDVNGAIYPFNGNALLSTTQDGFWTFVYPSLIGFQNGVFQGSVVVTLAETLKLKCTSGNITGLSDDVSMLTGQPARLLTILPGEALAPGSPGGRLPRQPDTHIAGDSFTFNTYLTDAWFNVIDVRTDSVYFGSTDSFAILPVSGVMPNGAGTFPATFRRAGRHRIYARPSALQAFRADTSTAFTVVPGPFADLLLLLPGETHEPGDNAVSVWETPGKAGRPSAQYVREPFDVTIYPCDACWNRVTAPGLTVRVLSDFQFSATPAETTLADSATFAVEFGAPGSNQNIWATAEPGGYASYETRLDIRARGQQLKISAPDTVRAGETTDIIVVVRDANGDPIVATVCGFTVEQGNGDMLDANLRPHSSVSMLTDTVGTVNAKFLCTRARFAEHDSIRITSGNADTLIGIYVAIPDSEVMKGEIIAVPNPFGSINRDVTEIHYYLQRSSPITVSIYDPFGNEVIAWEFAQNSPGAKSGANKVTWDGRGPDGRRVASGVYVVQVLGEVHTGTFFKAQYRIGVIW